MEVFYILTSFEYYKRHVLRKPNHLLNEQGSTTITVQDGLR